MSRSLVLDVVGNDAETAAGVVLTEIDNVVERLTNMRELLLTIAPECAVLRVSDEHWSVKDAVAHLSAYYPPEAMPEQVRRLRALAEAGRGGRAGADTADIDAANEAIRLENADRSLAELFDVIVTGRAALRQAVSELSRAELVTVVDDTAWGSGVPIWRIILESTVWHDEHHLDEIDAAVLAYDAVLFYQYLDR